jgi:GNAT superfamily N-acetyltransferase
VAVLADAVWVRDFDAARDLERCMAIWRSASEAAHAFLGAEALREDAVLVRAVYMPRAEILVAGTGLRVAGFLALVGDEGHVGGLFVAPSAQGRGIGRRLVETAASRRGALTVEVYAANAGARTFYAALGFRATGSRAEDQCQRQDHDRDLGPIPAGHTSPRGHGSEGHRLLCAARWRESWYCRGYAPTGSETASVRPERGDRHGFDCLRPAGRLVERERAGPGGLGGRASQALIGHLGGRAVASRLPKVGLS